MIWPFSLLHELDHARRHMPVFIEENRQLNDRLEKMQSEALKVRQLLESYTTALTSSHRTMAHFNDMPQSQNLLIDEMRELLQTISAEEKPTSNATVRRMGGYAKHGLRRIEQEIGPIPEFNPQFNKDVA